MRLIFAIIFLCGVVAGVFIQDAWPAARGFITAHYFQYQDHRREVELKRFDQWAKDRNLVPYPTPTSNYIK